MRNIFDFHLHDSPPFLQIAKAQESIQAPVNPKDILTNDVTLEKYLVQNGSKKTLATLLTVSLATSADCHQQAHLIGRIGYKIYKQEAFRQADYSCHSGAYHGAMEAFLNENGTQNLAENINKICQEFDSSFGKFECLHGVGHGILAYDNYDMPQAITDCKDLGDSWSSGSCFGGVFMENIMTGLGQGAGDGHETVWLNQKDPHFPCNAAKAEYVLVCFKSYGRDAAGQALRDPVKIIDYCEKITQNTYFNECIAGALNVIVDFWGDGLKDQATHLCRLLIEGGKKVCYSTLASRLYDVFPKTENREAICRTFEEDYKDLCPNY